MQRIRRMMALVACAALMLGNASGEAAFDFTVPTPSPVAPAETPAPTAAPSLSPAFEMEVIRPKASAHRGTILIYHTHTWEAYRQTEERYQETEKWRTKDEQYNVVAVGEALSRSLIALGCTVVHDTTAFEPPNLADAYARSLTMLEQRTAAGETYDLYIDLHRDAISATSTIRRTVVIGGEDVARFMVLVGKGTTGGYAEKPDFEANLQIAQILTAQLEAQCEGLSRDVKIRTGRFNQHIAPRCILIECGTNENTLEEVIQGVPYLAQAIVNTLKEMEQDGNNVETLSNDEE